MFKHQWYGIRLKDGSLFVHRFFPDTNVHEVANRVGVMMVYGPFQCEHRVQAEMKLKESVKLGK